MAFENFCQEVKGPEVKLLESKFEIFAMHGKRLGTKTKADKRTHSIQNLRTCSDMLGYAGQGPRGDAARVV